MINLFESPYFRKDPLLHFLKMTKFDHVKEVGPFLFQTYNHSVKYFGNVNSLNLSDHTASYRNVIVLFITAIYGEQLTAIAL